MVSKAPVSAQNYVAFLRAINVGGRIVKMNDLKAIFQQLGLADVTTFIASGNVIFRAGVKDVGDLEKQIAQRLQHTLGYPVATFVRTTSELARIAQYQAFPKNAADGATLFIGFLPALPTEDARLRVMGLRTETDDLRVEGRELYWLCRTTFRDSRVSGAALEKALKMAATLRNATTVRKLAAKYPPATGVARKSR